ncbi:MAG: hypothetical protein VCA55_04690, partial [Verrucomicrobiales bacterium]
MMDTGVETTVKAGNFVGKLFPTASVQLGGAGGVAWDWRFGLLRRIYPYVLFGCDLVLITAIYSLTVFLRQGELAVQMVSKQVLLMLVAISVSG